MVDASVQQAIDSPKNSLDEALKRTREFLASVEQISHDVEDLDIFATKETKAHREVKAKFKNLEDEHSRIRVAHDDEKTEHIKARTRIDEHERSLQRLQEELKTTLGDLQTVRLENEALRVEMEAKRQAFVVNLNMASRHAELRAKHDEAKEENSKLANELEELQSKLQLSAMDANELEELRAQAAREKMRKSAGKQRAMLALERSLAKNDEGLLSAFTIGWSQAVREAKTAKKKKDDNMQRTMRAIAGASSTLMHECFTMWDKIKDAELKRQMRDGAAGLKASQYAEKAKAQEKVIKQLEKQFGASDQRLVLRCFEVLRDQKKVKLEKERSKAAAARAIAGSDSSLLTVCMSGWGKTVKEVRAGREKKDQSMAKAMQMISASTNVLLGTVVNMWQRDAQKTKDQKKMKDEASTKAMRLISNSSEALIASVCQGWILMHKKEKDKAKKMKMVERSLVSSAQGMQAMVYRDWAKYARENALRNAKKNQSMSVALRKIDGSNMAILDKVFTEWEQYKERVKQAQLLERGRQAEAEIEKARAEIAKIMQTSYAELEAHRKLSDEQRAANENRLQEEREMRDARIAELKKLLEEKELQLKAALEELHDSRVKAASIADELGKVGMFLQKTPRRTPQPYMSSASGRASPDVGLPRIEATSTPRPVSGGGARTKAGSTINGGRLS